MASYTGYASGTPATTGTSWSTPTSATGAPNSVYAVFTNAVANAVGTITLNGFGAPTLAVGTIITGLTADVKSYVSATNRWSSITAQLLTSTGTTIGTAQTVTLSATTTNTQTIIFPTLPTVAQVNAGLQVRITATHYNGTISASYNLDSVGLTLTYAASVALPFTDTFTGTTGAALGDPWVTVQGTAAIDTNRAKLTSAAVANAVARVDATPLGSLGDTDFVITISNDLGSDGSINVCLNGDGGQTSTAKARQDNCYYMTLTWSSQQFRIGDNAAGTATELQAVNVSLAANTQYRARFQRVTIGGVITLRARMWLPANAEPSTWDLTATPGTTRTGFPSFARSYTNTVAQSTITYFDDATISVPSAGVIYNTGQFLPFF